MIRRGAPGLRRVASTRLPTRWGVFQTFAFERERPGDSSQVETAIVLLMGDISVDAPLLRIHSQCLTGEMFGSLRCDCREQLDIAMSGRRRRLRHRDLGPDDFAKPGH